jgi:hypothetical protein
MTRRHQFARCPRCYRQFVAALAPHHRCIVGTTDGSSRRILTAREAAIAAGTLTPAGDEKDHPT